MNKLTTEEIDALREYADKHGRNWKSALRQDWMNATSIGTVHALRNQPNFGPAGLNRFTFPK